MASKLSGSIQNGNETALMVKHRDVLKDYVENRLMNSAVYGEDHRVQVCFRRVVQSGALVGIACARIGVVMICINGSSEITGLNKYSAGSLSLAVPNIIGSTVSFGVVSVYSTFALIDATTRAISPEEKALIDQALPRWKRALIGTFSVAAGLLTQVPFAYATYLSSTFTPEFLATSQFLDSGRSSYSTYMTLMGIVRVEKKIGTSFEKSLLEIRQGFAKEIGKTHAALQYNRPERRNFLTIIDNLEKSIRKDGVQYLNELFNLRVTGRAAVQPLSKCADRSTDVGALLMSGAVLAEFWQLAGMGAQKIDPNSVVLPYVSSALVTLSLSYLWFTLIRKATKYSVNYARGAIPPSITEPMNPTFYSRFTKIGTACASMTWVGSVYFAKIGFEALSKAAYYTIGGLATVGSTLGAIGAVHSLRDNIIRARASNDDDILLLRIDKKLQNFAELIGQIPLQRLEDFIKQLPEDFQTKFISFSPTLVNDRPAREAFLKMLNSDENS